MACVAFGLGLGFVRILTGTAVPDPLLVVGASNLLDVEVSGVMVRVLSRRASVEGVLDLAYVGTVLDVCVYIYITLACLQYLTRAVRRRGIWLTVDAARLCIAYDCHRVQRDRSLGPHRRLSPVLSLL